jgi:cell division protein FtsI (penicillin-binding protein 3)
VDHQSRRRAGIIHLFFCALFLGLISRLYCVQIRDHEKQSKLRDIQTTGKMTVEDVRGVVKSADGQLLAVSCPVEYVWVNPAIIADHVGAAKILAPILGMKEAEILAKLAMPDRKWVILKKVLTSGESGRIRTLMTQAPFKRERRETQERIGIGTDYRRQYPHGSVFGPALGHESADPGHDEGLEKALAPLLTRPPRTVSVSKDGRQNALGAPTIDLHTNEATLTIDLHLQEVVEDKLEAACAEFRPKWAVAIAMDPRTGAILALANRPTYDPNKPGEAPAGGRLNRAVTFPYEPGSTLKPFTAAYALDLNLIRPDTMIDCENGLWHHGPRGLHDHHPYAKIPLSDVIKFSSNIGAAKIGALTLGQKRLYECMKMWGFGTRTGVDLPAEDPGLLFPLSRWTIYSETSVPMGHEISVTPLQLTTAMCAIANGGTLYKPYIVRRVTSSDGSVMVDNGPQVVRRVIGPKAAKEMVEILKGVVKDGTGKKAAVPGVEVAGKTGTSQKIDPRTKQYTHEKYIASFVGFAPANDPKLCVAVILDEPQGGSYYGGAVAAPVVGQIVQHGLIYVK